VRLEIVIACRMKPFAPPLKKTKLSLAERKICTRQKLAQLCLQHGRRFDVYTQPMIEKTQVCMDETSKQCWLICLTISNPPGQPGGNYE